MLQPLKDLSVSCLLAHRLRYYRYALKSWTDEEQARKFEFSGSSNLNAIKGIITDMNYSNNDRATFAPGESERLLRLAARRFSENWPELGTPAPYNDEGQQAYKFDQREGVEVRLGISDSGEGMIFVDVEMTPTRPHIAVPALNRVVEHLDGRWHWFPGRREDRSSLRLFTELGGAQVGLLGEAVFLSHINELRNWCDALCPQRAVCFDDGALKQAYKAFDGTLKPVLPWINQEAPIPASLGLWSDRVFELIAVGTPVGIPGETPVERRLARAVLAERCLMEGTSLALPTITGIEPQKLIRLAKDAPGYIAVPARVLAINNSVYELPEAVNKMMNVFEDMHIGCVFEGSYKELDMVFHGGQGAENDPLKPSVCRIPDIPTETLTHFAFWDASQRLNLPLPANPSETVDTVCRLLQDYPSGAQRLLPRIAVKILRENITGDAVVSFIERLSGYTETFGSIGVHPSRARSVEVQQCFQKGITSPGFARFLKNRLFGQDMALEDYVDRLQEEVLTRALHQPLVIALQGTPGTGKSECLALTAAYLNLPHVVIDVASIPDSYTGMAQLLGSGRGIVGSYQAGRLEQVARHHQGAVVEIADIDHALPSVRASVGDLFLQVMQNGDAQAAIGSTFSCAGLLLGFTLNLPGGKDEKAYQRVGFGGGPTMTDIRREVQKEIKNMVSGAFLSRLGEPILFEPLSMDARITIVDHALRAAAHTMLNRLGSDDIHVEIEEYAVRELVLGFDRSVMTFGARGLVDMARRSVVRALLPWYQENLGNLPASIYFATSEGGSLEIRSSQPIKQASALENNGPQPS